MIQGDMIQGGMAQGTMTQGGMVHGCGPTAAVPRLPLDDRGGRPAPRSRPARSVLALACAVMSAVCGGGPATAQAPDPSNSRAGSRADSADLPLVLPSVFLSAVGYAPPPIDMSPPGISPLGMSPPARRREEPARAGVEPRLDPTPDAGTVVARTETVTGMRITPVGAMTRVVFDLTGPIDFRYRVARDPNLVTLTIPTTRWAPARRPAPRGLVADFAYDGTIAPGGGLRLATNGPVTVARVRLFRPRGTAPYRLVLEFRAIDTAASSRTAGGTTDIPWASTPRRPDWMVPRLERPGAVVMAALPAPATASPPDVPAGDNDLVDLFEDGDEVAGLATGPDIDDPLEGVNRAIFWFNNNADRYVLGPISAAYGYVTPDVVKHGIRNFLANVREPVVFVNKFLQFDMEDTALSLGRFLINSTLGLGGLIDLASDIGLEPQRADFGQTLYLYGVGSGPYLMLPFSGPATLRDAVAQRVDGLLDPSSYLLSFPTSLFGSGGRALVKREALGDQLDDLRANAIDFYSLVRSLYVQNRMSFLREADNLEDSGPGGGNGGPPVDALETRTSSEPGRPGAMVSFAAAAPGWHDTVAAGGTADDRIGPAGAASMSRPAAAPAPGISVPGVSVPGRAEPGPHRPLPLMVTPATNGAIWLPADRQ